MSHVFTRRLMLEAPVRTPDGGGGHRLTWEVRGGLWAEVRLRSGSLRHGAFGRTERLGVRLRTHVVPEGQPMRPEPGHRLRDGGQVYEVEAVHSDDGHVLTMLASVLPGAETGRMSYAMGESLQAAIYTHLKADTSVDALVGGAVFDDVPPDAPDLLVAIGPDRARGIEDSAGSGAVHQLTISVVTRREGYMTAKAVAVAVSDTLSGRDLALTRGRLVSLRFVRAEARRDKTEGVRRIDLIFRARTDDTGL